MKCTSCDKQVPENAKVCGYCGHRLKAVVPSTPEPPLPAPIQTMEQPTSLLKQRRLSAWAWGLVIGLAVLIIGVLLILTFQKPLAPVSLAKPSTEASQQGANAQAGIIVETFKAGDSATKLSEISQETGENAWTANITANTVVRLNWGWCATTQETLEQNLQHMQILFFVDGMDVTSTMAQEAGTIEGGVCRTYNGVIRAWPTGKHVIQYKMIFEEKVNDGENDYEGENIKTYIINVTQ